MKQSEQNLNLMQKLAKIRAISDAVAKDKRGFNYTYAEITQILAKVTTGMKAQGVSLIPVIVPGTAEITQVTDVNTKTDKTGAHYDQTTTEYLVKAGLNFKWVNDENPEEFIEVPWLVVGEQADPSQAFGSGLTYCTRYFLTSYFQIGQDNDVDAYRSKQRAAEQAEDLAIAKGLVDEIDGLTKKYLGEHPDGRDELIKFFKSYVKDGNYKKINEPELAGKLLGDLKTKITEGK